MKPVQRAAFEREIARARELAACGRLDTAFAHLERAHVLGQRSVVPHATTHWLMLRVELRRRRTAAALGQVARIALGALGSAVGVVPAGNTGGSDVGVFARMPIDAELQSLLDGVAPPREAQHAPGGGE